MAADHIGPWRTDSQGHLTPDENGDLKTDYSRWRLLDDRGRQTWHYLENDEENEKWPQTVTDKYFLGLPTVLKKSPKPIQGSMRINLHLGSSGSASCKDSFASSREWLAVLLQSAAGAR